MIKLRISGEIEAKTRLAILQLDPAKRRRLLNRLAVRKLRPFFRSHVKNQASPEGVAYPKRKHRKPKQKSKMLSGLAKKLVVTKLTDTKVILSWSNRRTAMIASVHNSGATLKGSKRDTAKARAKMANKPATKEQAKSLRRLGYKVRKKGSKNYRVAGLKQITNSLSFNQAGLIIKLLKDERGTKQNWDIPIPQRQFIGVIPSDINQLIDDLIPQIINSPTGA